jgi:hypothetical protein
MFDDFTAVHCYPWPPGWGNPDCYKFLKIYHALITLPDVRNKTVDKITDKALNAIFEQPDVKIIKKAVDIQMAAVTIVYTQTIRFNFSNLTDAIRRNGPAEYQGNGIYVSSLPNNPGLNLSPEQFVILCIAMCRYVFGRIGP